MQSILSALQALTANTSFWAKQNLPAGGLRITIKEHGGLKYPVSARAAKSLIKFAKPAKYGLRDKTLLDPKVRHVWEIPKSRVKIDNQTWNKTLTPVLDTFKSQLGLPQDSRLKAHLHNMLIYEPGQFFRPHQDSEKIDGMVASLVVVLPSSYGGGTLVLDHQGEKQRFQAPRSAKDKLTLIAFYADCHHEVKPVTGGYRLTLTYNLVLKNQGGKMPAPTRAQRPPGSVRTQTKASGPEERGEASRHIGKLSKSLEDYFAPRRAGKEDGATGRYRQNPRPKRWVYLLDHQYTQKSLGWSGLKGGDGLRVNALREVAGQQDLTIHLALADVQETWDVEEEDGYGDYGYSGYGDWYGDDYDEEDAEEEEYDGEDTHRKRKSSGDDYILNELIDRSTVLKHWVNLKDKRVRFTDLDIDPDEVCWTRSEDAFNPYKSEYEGFMGNYGNTLDRWYHRAAVVLWRRQDEDAILCEVRIQKVVNDLLRLAQSKSGLKEAQSRVRAILPYWSGNVQGYIDRKLIDSVFNLALHIRDGKLARQLLQPLGLEALKPRAAKVLLKLEAVHGEGWCLALLQSWLRGRDESLKGGVAPVVKALTAVPPLLQQTRQTGRENPFGKRLIEFQYGKLKKEYLSDLKYDNAVELARREKSRNKAMVDLLTACHYADAVEHRGQIVRFIREQDKLFPVFVLTAILHSLASALPSGAFRQGDYSALADHAASRLQKRIAQGPRDKKDWSINHRTACSCADCKTLNTFLRSSGNKTLAWPLAKERRRHIHQSIDGLGLPVSHRTLREGSPHKLILTKTEQLFKSDREELARSKSELRRLRPLTLLERRK